MKSPSHRQVSADEARAVAEEAREERWSASFARKLFLGDLPVEMLEQLPADREFSDAEEAFLVRLDRFLESVDPEQVERDGRLPPHAFSDLARIGAMGIRIPTEYGGLGLGQHAYQESVARAAGRSGALAALLSAHQSIGVPKPLLQFGTEEQMRRFLPRLAAGAVSAFALTERGAGSDPARIETTADDAPDGDGYILNGEKLWCTNGAIAELLVVMAVTPDRKGRGRRPVTAFIVDTSTPGVEVTHRCEFMGLRGIENAVISFRNVRVPRENLLGDEGRGLRIALTTLNTGRLTLPAMCARSAEWCLGVARKWASERVQWGAPVGQHEAVAAMIAELATNAFATRAVSELATDLSEAGLDVRLEAALAKLYTSEVAWRSVDLAMQVRGGRGYETASSLAARGEEAVPLERVMRDLRINRIFEGSSEIMRLFVAREALDPHVRAAGAMAVRGSSIGQKARSFVGLSIHMKLWALRMLKPMLRLYRGYGPLSTHMMRAAWLARLLGWRLFWALTLNGPALEKRQRLLGRLVDAGAEILAMVAACRLARRLQGTPEEESAVQLADGVCRASYRRACQLLSLRAGNLDRHDRALARSVLEGEHSWIEPR
jgi:alkylation response protein AidB-like acyl-CoA dehydrogenase